MNEGPKRPIRHYQLAMCPPLIDKRKKNLLHPLLTMDKHQEFTSEEIACKIAEEEQRKKEYYRLKQQRRRAKVKKLRKPRQSMTEAEQLKYQNDMDQLLHASQESRELEKHPDGLAGLTIDEEVRKKYFDEVVNHKVSLRPILPKTHVMTTLDDDIQERMQEIEPKVASFDEIVVEQERMSRLHSDHPYQLTRQAISRSAMAIETEDRGKSLISYADIVEAELEDIPIYDQLHHSSPEGDELENGTEKGSDLGDGNLPPKC